MKKIVITALAIGVSIATNFSSANVVGTAKRGYETYLTAQSIIEEPRKIVALKISIDSLYQGEANYDGLSNELLINAGKISKDTDPRELEVSTFDIGDDVDAGYRIKLTNVREDTCKQFVRQLHETKFIKRMDIYNSKMIMVDSCQKDSLPYKGNNTVIFSQEYSS
ncbi:hypothetical protein D8T36_21800 [Vibrio vulnificus]|uniref:type 4 pilus major pilin n=1 Tax=Vibrio vulnificus TaxID=672 RepID=UPI001022CB45|nr:type 4 pilus major pilin [Vibrio vulnificus]RZP85422.1 hypothetical protein D8T54_23185 [Vibrio vulnificus]RZQ20057.1 hypothetical protein D8T36_21800 [Vibrio vulnificus]